MMSAAVLQNLASLALAPNAESQNMAAQFVEQLKQSQDGWKICAEGYTCGTYHQNDHVQFFCLQVCEHYVKTRYVQASAEDTSAVKAFVLTCIDMESNEATQSKSFIRNKLAQLASLVYMVDFPQRWPQFFHDIMTRLSVGPLAVDMYLRVLLAVHSEVVDKDICHNAQETQRNNLLKDAMRQMCVSEIADSWYQIMTTYETSHPDLTNMCLEVVGDYVSWMDIGFFANDRMVELLLRFLVKQQLREAACDAVHDIISKGMSPAAKTSLIESFMSVLDSAGIFKCDEDDTDFLSKLSKLINGMGIGLIRCRETHLRNRERLANKGQSKDAVDLEIAATVTKLETKIPYMLSYLGHEDDDVSSAVVEFASEYIAMLKTLPAMSEEQKKHVEGLLLTIIKKLKYDDTYNFEKEGEEEAEFQEYRKRARVIFNNLASLDSKMILSRVHELASTALSQWETTNYKDVEIAISLIYNIGEAIPSSQGQHFNGNPEKATALQELMRLLITSQVSRQGHIAVLLQFFETIIRYDRFFVCETQHIPEALMAFLDERGLRNGSARVRSRVGYLFLRFVKSTKGHLTPYLEEVLKQIHEFLAIKSPGNDHGHLLSDNDQLFIYEAASTLIISSSFEPEKKQAFMKELLMPIASKFTIIMGQLVEEQNEARQQAYADCINNAMSLASRASKGFSGQQTMQVCGCVSVFTELLSIFLAALEVTTPQRGLLQQGVRQYLHRMVVCLEEEILPFLPQAMEKLLKQPDAKELYDFLPLVNQIAMKFKAGINPFLSQVFMPLVLTVHQVLASPTEVNDRDAAEDKKMLQRGYFLFLSTIVCNCIDVLKAQDMQNLQQVLMSLIHGGVEMHDPNSQKSCFATLKKLIQEWGGKDVLPGFPEFIYKEIIPACFAAPLKPTFDLNDGQTVLALGETASCMQEIFQQRGQEMLVFLRTDFFPSKGIGRESAEMYIASLQTNLKGFRKWLKSFFEQAKS